MAVTESCLRLAVWELVFIPASRSICDLADIGVKCDFSTFWLCGFGQVGLSLPPSLHTFIEGLPHFLI